MDDIKKALQEIAKAIENNDTVESVKVVVTLKKQSLARRPPKTINKSSTGRGGGRNRPFVRPIVTHRAVGCQPATI